METPAWKLFCLVPFLLLRRPFGGRRVSREDLCERFDKFTRGEWHALLEEALAEDHRGISKARTSTLEAKARAACQKVQLGEVSRARQCLVGASIAPGTEESFRAMQDRRPQEVVREIPAEVREFQPEVPVSLDKPIFLKSLRSARRGSSPGPGVGHTSI